ncbi:aminotransferase class III-fold pyridoxal phosphate-dependent enzyme [Limnospira fusiformis]|uniref:aminotransferase class III-fold pyridoxal phosphate-dependent enzyme n=1 Tax=Limnospira fusiformis TaxID=54297 RepID=UPI0034E0B6B1
MKTLAIVQARMGSTRFPNKVMRPISGVPMIGLLLQRLAQAKRVDKIILATSVKNINQSLVSYVANLGYEVYQGSEDDVLDRYYQVASIYQPEIVVRITGDCPLIDSEVVDNAISMFESSNIDYLSNVSPPTYPDGLDVEVFSFTALAQAWQEARQAQEREHVTPYIRESAKFKLLNITHPENCANRRWTVDEPEDFEVVKNVFEYFAPRHDFSWLEVLRLEQQHPELFTANQHLVRNEGATLGKGQKLWKRAKRVIPGGNMLLSKRAEMFLPEKWPAYFSKAKGCYVWDMDGRQYIDMSIMGIGTNILGYGHPEVDEAVHQAVHQGNMSTFNCPEEVYLAERLVELHPWADMVRFARTGGEANAIAIRIARAASGKDKVAICGYHGWHDWYLAANLGDDGNLAGHLLPGLEPNGVPSTLKDTIYPFKYNDFNQLETLVQAHDIGTIKMEVSRSEPPKHNFLNKVRKLATDKGIVLIFDECTSGFRQTLGGLHKLYGVEPDMAMFGKALGNGYAITATIGRREVMEAAQRTFISSTFWTERIGPTAGLKTLEVMEKMQSWNIITEIGHEIRRRWTELANSKNLDIQLSGLPALSVFSFPSPKMLEYKTLITQEMLKKGYLAATSVYVCTEHKPEIIDGYFEALEPIFATIAQCEEGQDIEALLETNVCHGGFKRLN